MSSANSLPVVDTHYHLAEAIQDIAGVPILKSPPLAMDALEEKVKA